MKSNKIRSKKGMTLIELIISVTILVMLIIPISSMIIGSLKNSKTSEAKQQASYIGQKILEEIKAYDEIKLQGVEEKYFELLDGDKIKQISEDKFEGNFERTIYGNPLEAPDNKEKIYDVELTLKEDTNLKDKQVSNLDKINDYDFKLNFKEEIGIPSIELDKNIEKKDFTKDLIITFKDSLEMTILEKETNKELIKSSNDNGSNKIILYMDESFSNEKNIEIENKTKSLITIYVIKHNNAKGDLNLIASTGNILINNEINLFEEYGNGSGSVYDYSVTVKDKSGKALFDGSSSKNIIFNEVGGE